MQNINKEILEKISNETKNSIDGISIVTPSIYADIFLKYASSHDADIGDEHKITDYLLSQKISQFTNLQETTAKNAQQLSQNTGRAINAIKDKDETTLKKILQETKNLQNEIERLKKSIYKDELTGAYNRKWLHDNCLKEDSENFKNSGILAIIDLNYFKIINDTYGHIVGDKVLIFIANQLKKIKESVIRYGGDEFIIIFSAHSTKEDAYKILDTIRENIIKKSLIAKESSFKVSFSFGICEFKKDNIMSDVIEMADSDMYEDKIRIKKRIDGIY